MNSNLKLLFDECLGRPVMATISEFASTESVVTKAIFAHVLDYQRAGIKDREWIPERAKEGWILISTDRGKRGGGGIAKSNNLPFLCANYKMTHVLMGSAIHSLSQFEKGRAIISVWDELKSLQAKPPGSRFILRMGPKHPYLEQRL